MILGAHESVAGGAFTAFQRGREDGCETVQIFARPSAQWRSKPLAADEVSLFRSEHASTASRGGAPWPVLSHASYLINLSALDTTTLARSRIALEEEMTRAEELGIDFVVLHPGAHMGAGPDQGIEAASAMLSDLLEQTRGFHARLLLEITAGQGSCLGSRFEEMARLLERPRGGHALGVCFDTCHAHAAGYDLASDEGYDRVMAQVEKTFGIERIQAFHLNDSKTPAGSRVDRHQEVGDGTLGLLPFWSLVNDPRFARVPGVLEIAPGPDKENRAYKTNLRRLRALIGAPRPAAKAPPPREDRQQRLFE